MLTVFAVVFVFSLVVVVHELGHFLVCRSFGVRVEAFAIGFGKELIGFDWKGTRWSFCILPFGGYVKPAGEDLEETTGAEDEYFGQKWYKRILIALAGPIMNYILAVVCFFTLMYFWGQPQASNLPVVGELVEGFPAQAAGIMKNDKIVAINGKPIATWEDASKEIHSNPEKPIDIGFQRKEGSAMITKVVVIVPKKDEQRGIGLIGISPLIDMKPLGFSESWKTAGVQTYFWTVMTLRYIGDAVIHRRKPELAGPIGIVSIVAKVAHEGMQELMGLVALISLSLGLFNFFPVPLLDGGHVLLYLLEGISGKALNKTAVRIANIAGATLLIAIFLFATTQDISRLHSDFFK